MTQIQEIAQRADLSSKAGVNAALKQMQGVSDYDLHLYLVMRDTLNTTGQATRQHIALAQAEADRRRRNETRLLAFFTTIVSGAIALIGVGLGAYLTAPPG